MYFLRSTLKLFSHIWWLERMKRNQYTSKVTLLLSWTLMLWSYECDIDDQAGIRASPRRGMDLTVLYVGVCFSCFRFQLFETFSIPIKPLKHTTNSTDEPKDTYLTTLITVIWVCSLVGQPGIPRIMSILDVSAPHNLRLMPTFSTNAGSSLPHT